MVMYWLQDGEGPLYRIVEISQSGIRILTMLRSGGYPMPVFEEWLRAIQRRRSICRYPSSMPMDCGQKSKTLPYSRQHVTNGTRGQGPYGLLEEVPGD